MSTMSTNEQHHPAAGQAQAASKNGAEQKQHPSADTDDKARKKRPIFDRSLGTAAGLSKLLPTGTTLAFQTMAPSFTKGGDCRDHDVNFAFTCGLIVFLTVLSAALNFTDSVTVTGTGGKEDAHYGLVTARGLRLFSGRELVRQRKVDPAELRRRRRRREDFLHAFVSAAVFLALAFCDAGVQRCLLKRGESRSWKDFFNHLPLAVGFLASFLFIVFPTTRKGIGDDVAWTAADNGSSSSTAPAPPDDGKLATVNKVAESSGQGQATETTPAAGEKRKEAGEQKAKTLLGAAATLGKLLPTGTTLAFQTMAPSFTNGGDCEEHHVNFAFTWGLISLLAVMCAALCFTDSVTDVDGHTYYGVATFNGIWLFNRDLKDLRLSEKDDDAEKRHRLKQLAHMKRIRMRDFLHAVVSPAVFVAVAFCDAGVQGCLVPERSTQWREFLTLLPLAVAFLASFLFFIFPSDRKGIGEEGDAAFWHLDTTATATSKAEPVSGKDERGAGDQGSPGRVQQHHHNNQISCCVCVRA